MARKYKANRKRRAKSSYTSYKQQYRKYEKEGYTMRKMYSRQEYEEMRIGLKEAGVKNIARETARDQRVFTGKMRRDIRKSTGYTNEEIVQLTQGDTEEAKEYRQELFRYVAESYYDGDYAAAREAWGY